MSHGLNDAQWEAVHTRSGPLLVLAGAGTGKTRVVTFRIAELIRLGTAPGRILAVTFTNKAAAEMQQRIAALQRKQTAKRPVIGTFHSYCVQILRRHIRRLGYPQRFAIYDRGDQESLARNVLREVQMPEESLRPGDLINFISRWKTMSVQPRDAAALAQSDKQHLAAAAYRRYQQALKNAGAVDFDDLLLCTEELFQKYPDVLHEEAGRFDHLLVDEYQDTNGSQYRIVKAMASGHRNLCVVGDDDQSIYAWRGAEVEHILRFARDWPDAKVVRLEENYRSTEEILHMANTLIAFNKTRHDKTLRAARRGGDKPRVEQYNDETAEATGVVADIAKHLRRKEWEPGDFAILFRTNEQPRVFEAELRRADLPYILIGTSSFFDRKEVRDILAYLKVFSSPHDEVSLLRIINTPPRGIGSRTVEVLMQHAVQANQSFWKLAQTVDGVGDLPGKSKDAVRRFVSFVRQFRDRARRGSLVDMTRSLLDEIRYEEELNRLYDNETERQARWGTVEELLNAIGQYESRGGRTSLKGFLDDTALGGNEFDNEKEKQLQRNAIALLTMHSAKGLEYPHVYMVGMEEGLLPHRKSVEMEGAAVEEERRLCYVGVTRAQERLTLSLALTRRKWGKPRETIPSRFLFELIGQADNPHAAAKRKSSKPGKPPQRTRRP